MILAEENIQALLTAMKNYRAPDAVKWIDKEST